MEVLMNETISFIHPSDPQWKGGKESLVAPPSEACESSKHKHNPSVSLPYRRLPSSVVQQGDPSRRKQDDERDRERPHRERRKRDFEYLGRYIQERSTSLRGTSDRRSYSYHYSRSESVSRLVRPFLYEFNRHTEARQVCGKDRKYSARRK